tara:strand:+ start:62 stop:448 length:387 start_codon:yes stop_codon:yes gene_type:complete
MIGYVMVGTNDIKQSLKLYDKILPIAGMKKLVCTSDYVGYTSISSADEKIIFYITKPYNGKNATFGNGSMIALLCEGQKSVDNFHRVGLQNGAKDEGAPGFRPGYDDYFSYLRDFDGNKICAYYALSK